jgi:putative ABC transport system permease protein
MMLRSPIRFLAAPLRAFRRDIADRSFLVMGAAVVIAVASVTAVDMFTDRVRAALVRQSSALLAADVVVISNEKLTGNYARSARSFDLITTSTLSMRSVVTFKEHLQLTELKAVEDNYPLRGKMLVSDTPFASANPSTDIPVAGTAWVESRLLSLIGAQVGDRIGVGASTLRISKILVLEPDRGGDLFNIAPRVMINQSDIPATALIAPGSRVRYALLVAGSPSGTEEFKSNLSLRDGDQILSPDTARPEIRNALKRAEQYLGLATLTTILLAGVAIALAARSFAAQRRDAVALLRTLGATRRFVLRYFLLEILMLGLLTATIGAALGMASQEIIARSMTGWTQAALPEPSITAALRAAGTALLALTGFALPPLMNLPNVPPLRVLRNDVDATPPNKFGILIYALAATLFVAPWRADDIQLTIWSLIGLVVCLAALILAALATTKVVTQLRSYTGLVWRFGVANIARRGMLTTVQICALGLGLMVLLVLGIVRNDLLDDWLSSLPPDAPNQFLMNIQPTDVSSLLAFFERREIDAPSFYPIVRGRLSAINDQPITANTYVDPRARRLADREFNLSAAADLKPHNVIVEGQWWDSTSGDGQFSVERDIARTLNIRLGDTLSYRIAGREIHGTVTNLRAVQWESMEVNFFVEATPQLLDDLPATFITSFRLNSTSYPILRELVEKFPSVTVIDVAALVDHIRAIMDRSAAAIEFVFLFTLISGILVLIAAVQSTQDERVFESALLKTLGASRFLTLRIMGAEFLTIGFISGLVAGCVALLSGWLVATRVLEIDYSVNFIVILIGIVAGVASVTLVGTVAIMSALKRPAMLVLRYRD